MGDLRGSPAHLGDVLEVPHALQVARVVPAKIRLFAAEPVDQQGHRIHPQGVMQAFKPPLLGPHDLIKDVAAFHGIAFVAHAARDMAQEAA